MNILTPVEFNNVKILDGFWKSRLELNASVTIFSVMNRFKDTGRFEAFKFNWKEGSDKPKPHYFWDSDVAKWIESVGYILSVSDNPLLKKEADELIAFICKNVADDGYFNIYHTVVEPDIRFRKRDNHELYCLGHLIEAAIAYEDATGDRRLYDVVDRYIDYVIKVFCKDKSAAFVTPGHEEIELALIKLFRKHKNKKYLELAMFFIDSRGKSDEETADWYNSSYNQSHLPVRQQTQAFGHCVRACYLYTAMADAAKETGDEKLLSACKSVFKDIVSGKMYISGGLGSSHHGEAFTIPYDLPNDTAYAETCASIAMLLFADRMKDIDFDSKYADIVEAEMYNGILAGISLDGKSFFYENALEVNFSEHNRHTSMTSDSDRLPIVNRQEVFSCSCCPPNLTRFFASVGNNIFSYDEQGIYIHQYVSCSAKIDGTEINIQTEYPRNGKINISVRSAAGESVYLRIPGWCDSFFVDKSYVMNNGYAEIKVDSDNFTFNLDLDMKVEYYVSSGKVRADAGKVAVMYGPVLYCAESTDNDFLPHEVYVDTEGEAELEFSALFNANVITVSGYKTDIADRLYAKISKVDYLPVRIRLIPYFAHANRGECDMSVWLRQK